MLRVSRTQPPALPITDTPFVKLALRLSSGVLKSSCGNTIAGAMNFITKKPTEERSITLKTDVGNYDAFNGRVTFNVPLIGKNGYWQSVIHST